MTYIHNCYTDHFKLNIQFCYMVSKFIVLKVQQNNKTRHHNVCLVRKFRIFTAGHTTTIKINYGLSLLYVLVLS